VTITQDRNFYSQAEEKSEGETVDVLLSILPKLIAEINDAVNRTNLSRIIRNSLKWPYATSTFFRH